MHDISLFAVDIKGHRFGFRLNPFVCTLCSVPVFISLWCSSLYMYGRHHPHAPLVHLIFLLWISWVFHVISLHYHLFSPYCFPTTFIPIMSRVLHQLPGVHAHHIYYHSSLSSRQAASSNPFSYSPISILIYPHPAMQRPPLTLISVFQCL